MKVIPYILSGLLLLGCEESFHENPDFKDSGLLAVEAVFTNENTTQVVKLTYPYQQLNGTPLPATGAVVRVQEGTSSTYTFTENPLQPGEYLSTPFRAVFGAVYTLEIQLNGKMFHAQDSALPVEPLSPIQYQANNNQFELLLSPTGSSPNYVDHIITWQENNNPCGGCTSRLIFYDLKSIDVNELFKPGKKQLLFPGGSTVIRRKYSVSAAYRNFLRSMLSETEWRGGIFDVDRANTATNLSAGATGFFAVTTVVADTTTVQ